MRRKAFIGRLGALMGMGVAGTLLSACGGSDDDAKIGDVNPESLSSDEREGLQFMREEEKLAHDVYLALHARWGQRVFSQIAQSETSHMDAVKSLLDAYGVADPAAGRAAGSFAHPELQTLYNQLVQRGQASLIEALKVGCLIEEKDIADLAAEQAQLDGEPAIDQVYEQLMCGSRNHLRAFNSNLVANGGQYVPVYLSQADWNQIAGGANERCGG